MDGIIVWDTELGNAKLKLPVSGAVGEEKLHTAQVECMCWGFSGSVLFTGSKDNTIKCNKQK